MSNANEYAYQQSRQRVAVERILLDLIEELREEHQLHYGACHPCTDTWPCRTIASADRAEARLREAYK